MAESLSTQVAEDPAVARRPLRIALVTETYPPEVNGVALTLQRVVEGLRSRHHSIQLVRPRQGRQDEPAARRGDFEEVLVRGCPIPRYPGMRMGLPATRCLVALWRRERPSLVYVATEGPLGWSALQAASRLGLPVCSDFRTNFHAYSSHYGFGWLRRPIMAMLRGFHNRCAVTMVPSEPLRQELARGGFERLALVARGVDTALFDPARRSETLRRSWGVEADGMVALFVGRLAPEKNLEALARTFRAMHAACPALRLVVVGDGPAREALAGLLPDAILTGSQRGEALAAHYASADVFLFPSMTETFGNVTLEAMASGLAVLAFDHAAAGQFIRSDGNGLLARFDDEADFIRQALRLVGQREMIPGLAAQARVTASELGWDGILGQIEGVFATTLESASQPRLRELPERALAGAP